MSKIYKYTASVELTILERSTLLSAVSSIQCFTTVEAL